MAVAASRAALGSLVALALVAACSSARRTGAEGADADGGVGPGFTPGMGGAGPAPTIPSSLPPPVSGDGGRSGEPSGPNTLPKGPSPGSACTEVDSTATQPCGKCGTQSALCLSTHVWSSYGACENEVGECDPSLGRQACGNCGTRSCGASCVWSACTGEPANACPSGATGLVTTGCGTPLTFRNRVCGATCAWTNFSLECGAAPEAIDVSRSIGGVSSTAATFRTTALAPRLFSSCRAELSASQTMYVYTVVRNPAPSAAHVTLYHAPRDAADPLTRADFYVYAGDVRPSTPDGRRACRDSSRGAQSGEEDLLVKGTSLELARDVVVPGRGAITVYSQTTEFDGSSSDDYVWLNVRTESFE